MRGRCHLGVRAVALRTDALPLLLPELAGARILLGAPRVEPCVELVGGQHLDRRQHLRVLETAQLRALPCVDPSLLAWNQVSFVTPGIASILPPSAGIHQEWMTSVSGAVTSRLTGTPTGARSWSIAMTPFGYSYCQ